MIAQYQIEYLKKRFLKDYIGKELTAIKLKYDFIKYQENNRQAFSALTGGELIKIALEAGVKVKGYKNKKIEIEYKRNITKEELENLYYKENLSVRKIANRYRVSKDLIYDFMDKYGIRLKVRTNKNITKEELEELRKEYTVDYICCKLDISKVYYYKLANKYNIKVKKRVC